MGKTPKGMEVMKDPKISTLEQENEVLRRQLADSEKIKETMSRMGGVDIITEMGKIRAKGKNSAGSIQVKTSADHKNITLWTEGGKPVGPLHPDNAINTLQIFASRGIRLLVDRPTGEQQEAYHNSTEGQALFKKTNASRALKEKTRKNQMDRLTAEIAKMAGTTTDAVNRLLKAHEVK
jgi:hypothetical protein